MISDLPPGDKLALKGKIFELQKKLHIIECQHRNEEEFSYKPKILPFQLPEWRQEGQAGFLESLDKAEMIKRQKQDMLRAVIEKQQQEECTFSPVVNRSKSKNFKDTADNRPAFERLHEKGKSYQHHINEMQKKSRKYDAEGNRLFVPNVNVRGVSNLSTGVVPQEQRGGIAEKGDVFGQIPFKMNPPGTAINETRRINDAAGNATANSSNVVSADEFLYQDARDREERLRLKRMEMEAEAHAAAASKKMNSSSSSFLRRKAEREAKQVFDHLMFLCQNGSVNNGGSRNISHLQRQDNFTRNLEQATVQCNIFMGYDDLQRVADIKLPTRLSSAATPSAYDERGEDLGLTAADIELAWTILDSEHSGSISLKSFQRLVTPLLLHRESITAAFRDISSTSDGSGTANSTVTMKQLRALKRIVVYCLESAKLMNVSSKEGRGEETFKPKVSEMSLKLARRKERKEKQQILEVLNERRSNQSTSGTLSLTESGPSSIMQLVDSQDTLMVTEAELKHTDVMFARSMVMKKKKFDLLRNIKDEELNQCTFHPKISAKASACRSRDVFEEDTPTVTRLDSQADVAGFPLMSDDHVQEFSVCEEPVADNCKLVEESSCSIPASRPVDESKSDVSQTNTIQDNDLPSPPQNENTQTHERKIHETGAIRPLELPKTSVDQKECGSRSVIPTYERLYRTRGRPSETAISSTKSRLEEELKECTFKPRINAYNPNTSMKRPQDVIPNGTESLESRSSELSASQVNIIGGFDKTVNRMRTAQRTKEVKRLNESEEAMRAERERRYIRSRDLATQGSAPFHFSIEERRAERLKAQQERKNPNLIVDVKLNSTKTAKIQIWHGDDPLIVAESFGLIYSLDPAARQLLVSVIRKSMEDNGVEIGSHSTETTGGANSPAGIVKPAKRITKKPNEKAERSAMNERNDISTWINARHTRNADADEDKQLNTRKWQNSLLSKEFASSERSLSASGSESYDSDESSNHDYAP